MVINGNNATNLSVNQTTTNDKQNCQVNKVGVVSS